MSQTESLERLDLFHRLPNEARAETLRDVRDRVRTREGGDVRPLHEIRLDHAGRWVLLDRLEFEHETHLVAGRVTRVSDDRASLYRAARELGLKDIAVVFMGELSPEAVYVL